MKHTETWICQVSQPECMLTDIAHVVATWNTSVSPLSTHYVHIRLNILFHVAWILINLFIDFLCVVLQRYVMHMHVCFKRLAEYSNLLLTTSHIRAWKKTRWCTTLQTTVWLLLTLPYTNYTRSNRLCTCNLPPRPSDVRAKEFFSVRTVGAYVGLPSHLKYKLEKITQLVAI